MAFNAARLALVGNGGNSEAPRIWSYKTEDSVDTIMAANYFGAAWRTLREADFIKASLVSGIGTASEGMLRTVELVVTSRGVRAITTEVLAIPAAVAINDPRLALQRYRSIPNSTARTWAWVGDSSNLLGHLLHGRHPGDRAC